MMTLRLQDISPADARICLKIRRVLTEEIGPDLNGKLLVPAVSGGADSTALLHILHLLQPNLRIRLHAVTLDHGLRPQSAAEAAAVRQRCRELGMECESRLIPVATHAGEHGLGLEEAGRALRYAALEKERRRLGADWIVTGHQLDDLMEDQILRLLRGTGWPGLGGMPVVDRARCLARPLLFTPARALRAFLERLGLSWCEDESNADERFRRNRLRRAILPLLRAESPRLAEHAVQLHRMARADEAHWENVLAEAERDARPGGRNGASPPASPPDVTLERSLLCGLDKAGRLRLYLRTLRRMSRQCGRGQARADILFALDAAWSSGRGGGRFQFPGGITAEVRRGTVRFSLEPPGSGADAR